jgi:hypothetical protein
MVFYQIQQRTRIPKKALHVNRYGTVPVANLFERKWTKKIADPVRIFDCLKKRIFSSVDFLTIH